MARCNNYQISISGLQFSSSIFLSPSISTSLSFSLSTTSLPFSTLSLTSLLFSNLFTGRVARGDEEGCGGLVGPIGMFSIGNMDSSTGNGTSWKREKRVSESQVTQCYAWTAQYIHYPQHDLPYILLYVKLDMTTSYYTRHNFLYNIWILPGVNSCPPVFAGTYLLACIIFD